MPNRSLFLCLLTLLSPSAFAADPVAVGEHPEEAAVVDGGAPALPFAAVVVADGANVRLGPSASKPIVGLLRKGSSVQVTACDPDCVASDAWALLGSQGSVRLSTLRRQQPLEVPVPEPGPEKFEYGRVGPKGIRIYATPDLRGRLLSRRHIPREMSFRPNPELRAKGWIERVAGGFVRVRQVQKLLPSGFQGQAQPQLPLAFLRRELVEKPEVGKAKSDAKQVHRHDRLTVRQVDARRVGTDAGWLPRGAVALALRRARPESIPAGAKWVDVNLAEQTMTAYEGDVAVFATMVSTGKGKLSDQTHAGLFRVQHKLTHAEMRGEPGEPYDVERVPYALYFNLDEAFHGTYWHDSFGTKASHGCINLSLADASWLFTWAPPELPAGWSAIDVQPGAPTLWVLVEDKVEMETLPASEVVGTLFTVAKH